MCRTRIWLRNSTEALPRIERRAASPTTARSSAGCVPSCGRNTGRAIYQKRKALVEPVFGTLKEQRQGRRFRLRGLKNVAVEFCLLTMAYNLTRLYQLSHRAG